MNNDLNLDYPQMTIINNYDKNVYITYGHNMTPDILKPEFKTTINKSSNIERIIVTDVDVYYITTYNINIEIDNEGFIYECK